MSESLRDDLLAALSTEHPLEAMVATLVRAHDAGMSQQAALALLEGLREGRAGVEEDLILDAMDRASGWCGAALRIWR